MALGKFDASFRNCETNLQPQPNENKSPDPVGFNAKLRNLFNKSLTNKENDAHAPVNGNKRPAFSRSTSALQTLVKNVKNLFSPKIPKSVAKAPTELNMARLHVTKQNSFTSRKERKESAEKENFLDQFNNMLSTHKYSPRSRDIALKSALKDTLEVLKKADKAGILDEQLYASVTHKVKTAFSDRRQSMNLDDESPPTIHQQLIHDLKPTDPLRQNLERHAMTNELTRAVNSSSAPDTEKATQREIIKKACAAYPPVTETTVEVNGNKYTALLVPNDQMGHDILIRGKELGKGGESIVYKAHSVRDQKDVAVIYARDNANGAEDKENAKKILEVLGVHTGIQGQMQRIDLKTESSTKPVLITEIVEEGDFENYLIKEKLFTTLPPNIMIDLKNHFKAPGPHAAKLAKLNNFADNYQELLAANYGKAEVDKLFESFKKIISKSPEN